MKENVFIIYQYNMWKEHTLMHADFKGTRKGKTNAEIQNKVKFQKHLQGNFGFCEFQGL